MKYLLTLISKPDQIFTDKDAAKIAGVLSGEVFRIFDLEYSDTTTAVELINDVDDQLALYYGNVSTTIYIEYKTQLNLIAEGGISTGVERVHSIDRTFILDSNNNEISTYVLGLSDVMRKEISDRLEEACDLMDEKYSEL